MARGTFLKMDKVRAGFYENIIPLEDAEKNYGSRGTVAVPVILSWGAESEITKVTASDMYDGTALKLIGTDNTNLSELSVKLAFKYAHTVLFYRANSGGVKASATLGNLDVEAKYSGTFGNKISVSVVTNGTAFDVITFVDGTMKDKQTVEEISELVNNDFVVFDGTGDLAATAGTTLANGTNGTVAGTAYTNFLSKLDVQKFDCLAMTSTVSGDITATITKINYLREQGHYIQGVVIDSQQDNEYVISIKQGLKSGTTTINKSNVAILIASLCAGTPYDGFNTHRTLEGITDITDILTNAQIINSLELGYMVFSKNSNGDVIIEKDINTLHTDELKVKRGFNKNRTIRIVDGISDEISAKGEYVFIGKQPNTEYKRDLLKASILDTLKNYENMECIKPTNTNDIEVTPGESKDTVVVGLTFETIDGIEKIYTTIKVK